DAAHDGVDLVIAEIVAGPGFYQTEDVSQLFFGSHYPAGRGMNGTGSAGDIIRRQNKLRRSGSYRAPGHVGIHRRSRLLDDDSHLRIPDRLHSFGAVGPGTGKENCYGLVS